MLGRSYGRLDWPRRDHEIALVTAAGGLRYLTFRVPHSRCYHHLAPPIPPLPGAPHGLGGGAYRPDRGGPSGPSYPRNTTRNTTGKAPERLPLTPSDRPVRPTSTAWPTALSRDRGRRDRGAVPLRAAGARGPFVALRALKYAVAVLLTEVAKAVVSGLGLLIDARCRHRRLLRRVGPNPLRPHRRCRGRVRRAPGAATDSPATARRPVANRARATCKHVSRPSSVGRLCSASGQVQRPSRTSTV